MRQVLSTGGILLSPEELFALERRFNNDMGFNYLSFLRQADPSDYAIPQFDDPTANVATSTLATAATHPKPASTQPHEHNIVQVLAKIKGQTARARMRITDFIEGYDRHNEQCVCVADFRRGLDAAGIRLTAVEVQLVADVFGSLLRPGHVDYARFGRVIEEVFAQPHLERAPLVVPLQHFASESGPLNCLNFEERAGVSRALETLCKHNDAISNLRELCTDFDRSRCGSLNRNQLLRALTARGLHNVVSSREFELLCKCFAVERGMRLEVDYRSLLKNLDVLACTQEHLPF